MSPDHIAEKGNRQYGIDHGLVAEQWPAHAVDQNMGNYAHRREDRDVHLRMTEKPEEVLPKKGRSAGVRLQSVADNQVRWNEETGSGDAVQNQQQARRQQHRE